MLMCKEFVESNTPFPKAIVGLNRGGMVPARIFADVFQIQEDVYTIPVTFYSGIHERMDKPTIIPMGEETIKRLQCETILLVDDIWDSGKSMLTAENYLMEVCPMANLITATIFKREDSEYSPDFWAEEAKIGEWIVFPWEEVEFKAVR